MLQTHTADSLLKKMGVKKWERMEDSKSLWDYLGIVLTDAQKKSVKFAPMPEMLVFNHPTQGRYEAWRTSGGDWVTVFAMTPDEKVVSVIEYKHGLEEVIIGLPAGNFNVKEDPATAMSRELLEETGFQAGTMEPLAEGVGIGISGRKATTKYYSYVASDLVKISEPKREPDELIEVAFIPLIEWLKLIESGAIVESSAITTTFMALWKLGKLSLSR